MIYVMDLVNVSLIYVTEEKKTHGKTSYTLDYEMAHMNVENVLHSAILNLMTSDIFSTSVSNCSDYLIKG